MNRPLPPPAPGQAGPFLLQSTSVRQVMGEVLLALIPGISRSGSTIAALLLKGVDGETAARFSFLLALPAVFGAALLSLGDLQQVPTAEIPMYLAGAGTAFFVGLLSIHCLMAVVRRKRLIGFAIYVWLLGAAVLTFTAV